MWCTPYSALYRIFQLPHYDPCFVVLILSLCSTLYLAVYAQASTPTLASRKDLQSPAPLRTKDAATVARDEQEVFAH